MSVVSPPAMSIDTAADSRRTVMYEIDELPIDADSEDPWPDLPADPAADVGDAITVWRGWERRQRLAQEQRGD